MYIGRCGLLEGIYPYKVPNVIPLFSASNFKDTCTYCWNVFIRNVDKQLVHDPVLNFIKLKNLFLLELIRLDTVLYNYNYSHFNDNVAVVK